MKDKGNNGKKTQTLLGSIVMVAALFVLGVLRVLESGGDATENGDYSQQTVYSQEYSEDTAVNLPVASTESPDTPSESLPVGVDNSSEVPVESMSDIPLESLPVSTDNSSEVVEESMPDSVEAVLEEAQSADWAEAPQEQNYSFRNDRLLNQHYEKHGIEMGFATIEEYVAAANAVINHPDVLHKLEAEDNDDVYFLEATNEFVVVSTDGYIRTYFIASGGIDYFNRQ